MHDYHGGTVHFLVLAGASLAGAVAAVVLAVRALLALRKNQGWRRMVALLACSGAVSLHVWGMLHLLGAVMQVEDGGTGSSPLGPCRAAGDQMASHVVGYDVVYEHNGVRRSARLPQDPGGPGARIALEVEVAPVGVSRAPRYGTPVPGASRRSTIEDDGAYDDEIVQTRRVDREQPVYYAPAPVVYGPSVVWIDGGWGHSYRHRRHW